VSSSGTLALGSLSLYQHIIILPPAYKTSSTLPDVWGMPTYLLNQLIRPMQDAFTFNTTLTSKGL
jgi:hypothetical protein